MINNAHKRICRDGGINGVWHVYMNKQTSKQ